jgi:hypothetical protein
MYEWRACEGAEFKSDRNGEAGQAGLMLCLQAASTHHRILARITEFRTGKKPRHETGHGRRGEAVQDRRTISATTPNDARPARCRASRSGLGSLQSGIPFNLQAAARRIRYRRQRSLSPARLAALRRR